MSRKHLCLSFATKTIAVRLSVLSQHVPTLWKKQNVGKRPSKFVFTILWADNHIMQAICDNTYVEALSTNMAASHSKGSKMVA